MSYKLSNSSLSQLAECERCFYFDRRLKIPRPQGIKSSMPTRVDELLKNVLDTYRGQLPPVLQGFKELEGFVLLSDTALLKKIRHWSSNPLKLEDASGNVIHGAFDDMLFNPTTGQYAMLDVKTTGKQPDQSFGERYYQKQVDIYTAMIEAGKLPAADFGALLFFWPVAGEGGMVKFESNTFFLKAKPQAAWDLFVKADQVLSKPEIPAPGEKCEYCQNHAAKQRLLNEQSCLAPKKA